MRGGCPCKYLQVQIPSSHCSRISRCSFPREIFAALTSVFFFPGISCELRNMCGTRAKPNTLSFSKLLHLALSNNIVAKNIIYGSTVCLARGGTRTPHVLRLFFLHILNDVTVANDSGVSCLSFFYRAFKHITILNLSDVFYSCKLFEETTLQILQVVLATFVVLLLFCDEQN